MKNSHHTAQLGAALIAAIALVLGLSNASEQGGTSSRVPATPSRAPIAVTIDERDSGAGIEADLGMSRRPVANEPAEPAHGSLTSVRPRARRLARLTQGLAVDPPALPEEQQLADRLRAWRSERGRRR